MSGILGFLGGLVKPVTAWVQGREERKKVAAQAQADVERTMAQVAEQDSAFAWKWALVKAQSETDRWTDEYALIVITGPVVLQMVAGVANLFGAGIDSQALAEALYGPLKDLPEWWSNTFQVAIWTALGVSQTNKLVKKFKGVK